MSDRAATEVKWHKMLEEYRATFLPEMKNNWSELSEVERTGLSKMNNFYCGLHTYVQVAEVAGAALLTLEPAKQKLGYIRIVYSSEPGPIRLIRTCAKSFARGGDAKNGVHDKFNVYQPLRKKLNEAGMLSIPIVPFRGNRFNIIFFNGGFSYFLHEEMREYIEGTTQPGKL